MALIARRSLVVLQAVLLGAMLVAPAARAADAVPTGTALVSDLNPSVRGQAVTFRATVTFTDGSPVTIGTVKFGRGSGCVAGFTQLQAARPVDANGVVTFTNADIGAGTTTIWGCYEGVVGATLASSASVSQVVSLTIPTTTLVVVPATGFFGATVDLAATLTVTSGGAPVAGASVAFSLNGAAVGSASTDASGVARLPGTPLAGIAMGTYPTGVGAAFAGNASRGPSSGSAALTVDPAAELQTVTTVTCADGSFTYTGEPVTPCSVTITSNDGLSLTPEPVYADNVGVGTATASYDYAGDASHAPSSDSETFEIDPAALLVDALPGSKVYGEPDPALSWTVRGFVADEDSSIAGVTGAAACARAPGESVLGGPYTITCAPGTLAASNYVFATGATGGFTIVPADASCSITGFTGPVDGLPHGASGSCTGILGEDLSAFLDLGPTFTQAPGGEARWALAAPDYRPQADTVSIVLVGKAPSVVTITCPDEVVFTGSAQAPCSASVTGAGGLDQSVDITYANNVLGTATATATYAGDATHLDATASTTFRIVYAWSGFLQPINDTGHQVGLTESRFKLGQTIPVKFVLRDAFGDETGQPGNPTFSRGANRGSCDSTAVADPLPDIEPTEGSTFTWDGAHFQFNWSTRGLTPGEYRIYASLADGTHHWVDVCLR